MPRRLAHWSWWRKHRVTVAFVVLALAGVFALGLERHDNSQRIRDIQHSRVFSCRMTYEGVREVFRPFFRPVKVRTKKEQRDIDKFNRTVDKLKNECGAQTSTEAP